MLFWCDGNDSKKQVLQGILAIIQLSKLQSPSYMQLALQKEEFANFLAINLIEGSNPTKHPLLGSNENWWMFFKIPTNRWYPK